MPREFLAPHLTIGELVVNFAARHGDRADLTSRVRRFSLQHYAFSLEAAVNSLNVPFRALGTLARNSASTG